MRGNDAPVPVAEDASWWSSSWWGTVEEPCNDAPALVVDIADSTRTQQLRSLCTKFMEDAARYPLTVIAILFASMAFFYLQAPKSIAKTSPDPAEFLPLDAPAIEGLQILNAEFSPGLLQPFSVLLTARAGLHTSMGQGCFSPEGYDAMQTVLSRLAKDQDFKVAGNRLFLGPTAMPANMGEPNRGTLSNVVRQKGGQISTPK